MTEISFDDLYSKALELGWDDMGVTPAKIPEMDIQAYQEWLEKNWHADLRYMENQKRCDPQAFFPTAKTALIFVTYYKQKKQSFSQDAGLIASYARGRDYHHVHRKRIKKYIHWLETVSGQTAIAKGFSDSSPLLEKALAVQAGLGWFGKNTLLIHKRFGTFTLLSGILTSLEFSYAQIKERLPRCGSCTKCLDACPTQALVAPYHLDAAKCLSYHLIESKKEIPNEIRKNNPGYVFGCDICQDVCPHNTKKLDSPHAEFSSDHGLGAYLSLDNLQQLEKTPEQLYGTPLQRRGVPGLKHTLLPSSPLT